MGVFFLSFAIFNRSCPTTFASLPVSPTTILEGFKLSYRALSLSQKFRRKYYTVVRKFFFILLVYPRGTVDLIIIRGERSSFKIMSMVASIELVSK